MDTKDERIRQRAYHLWEQEGRPDGRAEAHWEAATELLSTEEGARPPEAPQQRSTPAAAPQRPTSAASARQNKRER